MPNDSAELRVESGREVWEGSQPCDAAEQWEGFRPL